MKLEQLGPGVNTPTMATNCGYQTFAMSKSKLTALTGHLNTNPPIKPFCRQTCQVRRSKRREAGAGERGSGTREQAAARSQGG
eukprot:1016990-Pelagomonas_calceolata.AAC.1